jgi:hypothetical protein
MFVRLFLRRWNLEQLGQGSKRVRPAGRRCGKRLHVNEVASVGTRLLLCLVRGLVFRVIVQVFFCSGLNRGSVAREPDKRRPLREMFDGNGRPILRQVTLKPPFMPRLALACRIARRDRSKGRLKPTIWAPTACPD